MNSVLMFSGQGAQYVGMGKALFEEYESVRNLFLKANQILGYSITDIMFEDEEKLNDTAYTQVAMFTLYAGIIEVLKVHHITADYACGLSLGEYGAMYYAEMFDFETGLRLLEKRGQFMKEASANVVGKMSAIIGMEAGELRACIDAVDGYVAIANYNTHGQLVISGEATAVQRVNELALERGAKRAIVLNTSGPFHTKLMSKASEQLSRYLQYVEIDEPCKKLLLNTTGDFYEGEAKKQMELQITSSVKFYQMIEKLVVSGVDTFIEIGPKKTLCSFVKKIDRAVSTMNIEDIKTLEKTRSKLEVL